MSDSRQSPIPHDRVRENVDEAQRAKDNQREMAEQDRYLKDHGVNERPGKNPNEQPGVPDEETSEAERGD